MRIAAIRRPGRRPATRRDGGGSWPSPGWAARRCTAARSAIPGDYLDLALDGTDGELSTDPLVAICAHGKHDQCCAVRGRSACRAIAAKYPEFTWECSHLGGDRFAATMLVLPEGCVTGGSTSTDSAELVRLYLDGRLDNRFLRGRTSLPHAVQAAQYFAREEYGDDRIAGLHPSRSPAMALRVVLSGDSGPIEVILKEELSEPLLSQCHASVRRGPDFHLGIHHLVRWLAAMFVQKHAAQTVRRGTCWCVAAVN